MIKRAAFTLGLAIVLAGCASVQPNQTATDDKDFSYYFSKNSNTVSFNSLEEAKMYIESATTKLEKSINKTRAKGLAAKLMGPEVKGEKPVILSYFLNASISGHGVNLVKSSNLLDDLKNATTVTNVFILFYGDRATSVSNFYIKSGYRFSNNSQIESITFGKNEYKANYPIGWGLDESIKYLNHEKD